MFQFFKSYQLKALLIFIGVTISVNLVAKKNYWAFENRTTAHGLSHNFIVDIQQDKQGFIWIATIDGLNRYDGHTFKVYKNHKDDSLSLPSNIIRSICVDTEGTIWLGTLKGLCRYNPGRGNFKNYPYNVTNGTGTNDNDIYKVKGDNNGNLWIATFTGGLNKFNILTEKFEYYIHDSTDSSTIQGNNILTIHIDKTGNVWAGVKFHGISRYNAGNNSFINYNLSDYFGGAIYIPIIISDSDNNLWAGTGQGLMYFKPLAGEKMDVKFYRALGKEIKTNVINSISWIDKENFFLGYGGYTAHIFNVNTKKFTQCVDVNMPEQNYMALASTISSDGTIWLGLKDKGLKYYNPYKNQFNYITRIAGIDSTIADPVVLSIYEEKNGGLWLGTSNGLCYKPPGSDITNLNGFKVYKTMDLPNSLSGLSIVNSVYKDSYGIFWLGTQPGIAAVGDKELKQSDEIKQQWFNRLDYINTRSVVWSISEGANADIWIGTENGFYRYFKRNKQGYPTQREHFMHITGDSGSIPSAHVKTTYVDKKGRVWAGTMEGLSLYNGNGTFNNYLLGYPIRSIYIEGDIAYIGTEGNGLLIFDLTTQKIVNITTDMGLANNSVWGIINDKNNSLWLSTNNGLTKYNLISNKAINFYKQHGLQDNGFKTNSYHLGHSGLFYFGGVGGVNIIEPDKIFKDTLKPSVYLTALKHNNKVVLPGQKINDCVLLNKSIASADNISLNYNHKIITIEFSGIDFLSPQTLQYHYRLLGFNDNWTVADSKNNQATYTNLSKGKYVFQVKVFNGHGVESNLEEIKLNVRPPFWKTTMFYIFLFLVLIFLIFVYIKRRELKSKREQQLLKHERDLMQILMDNIPDKIYFKDTKSQFTRGNKALALAVGEKNPEGLLGKSDFDFFPYDFAQETYNDEQQIIRTGKPLINKEEYHLDKNDTPTWHSATKVPIYNAAQQIKGIVGISRDTSTQKEHEKELREAKLKAEESDKLKTAFLANMSHEIRTPMNAILGFLGLIEEQELSDGLRKEYIAIINSNGNILLKLIDDIIDIALIESGQVKLHNTNIDIGKFISGFYQEYQRKVEWSGNSSIKLKFSNQLVNTAVINSDEQRIQQILINFMENALKFTQHGEVEVGVNITDTDVQLYIKDTGIGISKEKLSLIFERFIKIEDEKDTLYRGTGLGLFISKRLAQLLGFGIHVGSQPNVGSKFWLSIPKSVINFENTENNHNTLNNMATEYNWSKYKVLIVEDEISNYKLLAGLLMRSKIQVLHAKDGVEALELFHGNPDIDLILMDIKLPRKNGIEATKEIREINLEIPIIAQTAFAMKHEKQNIMGAGCNEYLTKPIDKNLLYQLMAKYLQ